jgi:hypothetical protein
VAGTVVTYNNGVTPSERSPEQRWPEPLLLKRNEIRGVPLLHFSLMKMCGIHIGCDTRRECVSLLAVYQTAFADLFVPNSAALPADHLRGERRRSSYDSQRSDSSLVIRRVTRSLSRARTRARCLG